MNKLLFLIALISLPHLAHAAINDINIKADQQVEWHQNENKMVAIGNAIATKNNMSVKADELTGYYENLNGKNAIKTMHATGNVIMTSDKANGFGDTMDYDLKQDEAILKGRPAKIQTQEETITATDYIIYYPGQEKAIARGDIEITDKDNNKIYSDNLTSYFKKNAQDALEIDRVEIDDNVKIITKDATVTAKRGVYLPQTGIVNLYDDVIITQAGGNILRGNRAQSNLNTGISKILAGGQGGRVTGVFKEKSQEKEQ